MAESEIRQKLWIEKEVNLTQEECKLIKNINATLNTLTRIKPQGWDINENNTRAKEKDYQTVVRLTELLDRNIKDMKSLILAIGINSTIAKGVQDNGKIPNNRKYIQEDQSVRLIENKPIEMDNPITLARLQAISKILLNAIAHPSFSCGTDFLMVSKDLAFLNIPNSIITYIYIVIMRIFHLFYNPLQTYL